MTIEEVYEAALKIPVGGGGTYELDEIPENGALGPLLVRLNDARKKEGIYSIHRDDNVVSLTLHARM